MEAATNATHQSKRTRFADDDDTASATSNDKAPSTAPPKGLAAAFIRSFVASLQPDLAKIVEKLGYEHMSLLGKLDNKKTQVQRLQDSEDLIPRSARLNFKLNVSKRAEQRQEFTALVEETDKLVESYRKGLRDQIIKASKIEIKAIEDELRIHLCKACRIITKSFLVTTRDTGDPDKKVYIMMESFLDALSVNCKMTKAEFVALYKETHDLEDFPTGIDIEDVLDTQPDTIPQDIRRLKEIIEGVFVTSFLNFKQQQQQNEVALELKRICAGYFTNRDTADAVMAIDNEPAALRKLKSSKRRWRR
jgi:hypothetical protein